MMGQAVQPPLPRASRRSLLGMLGAAAVGFSLSSCGRHRGRNGTVNLYTWDSYNGQHTWQWCDEQLGLAVNASVFASNDELYAKLASGNPGYDVIVPTHHIVTRMREAGLLQQLDLAQIPHAANLLPAFRDVPFDPGRHWSMPYTWLALGIGYRKSKVSGVPDSWKWLFDSDRYSGRIAIYDQSDDLARMAAIYLGHGPARIDPAMLARIEAMLIRQKPHIRTFHSDNGQDLLLAGDVDLVMEFNGDIAQVMREDKDLGFVIPREGSLLASDCLCIPKGAPSPDRAHAFINFLLDGKVGADIARTILYPTPNAAALALMPADYRDNRVIYPAPADLARCQYTPWEGADVARGFEAMLTRVRAA